jgi:hypothetical protein
MDSSSGEGVKEQLANENSLLSYYIRVSNLKIRYPWIAFGPFETVNPVDSQVAAYRVFNPHEPGKDPDPGVKSVIIAHNTDYETTHTIPNNGDGTLQDAVYFRGFGVKKASQNVGWKAEGPVGSPVFGIPGYATVVFEER